MQSISVALVFSSKGEGKSKHFFLPVLICHFLSLPQTVFLCLSFPASLTLTLSHPLNHENEAYFLSSSLFVRLSVCLMGHSRSHCHHFGLLILSPLPPSLLSSSLSLFLSLWIWHCSFTPTLCQGSVPGIWSTHKHIQILFTNQTHSFGSNACCSTVWCVSTNSFWFEACQRKRKQTKCNSPPPPRTS